jgi:hypothetical protein
MSNSPLSPHDLALVEATAQRVLELLAERDAPAGHLRLVSASELAEVLGVSRDYVYRHAEELGAIRVGGDGPRSERGGRRLRFDVEKAIGRQSGWQAGEESQSSDPPAAAGRAGHERRRAAGSQLPLLPDRGGNRGRGSRARTS